MHTRSQEHSSDMAVCFKFQIAKNVPWDGFVQLGLMWRRVQPGEVLALVVTSILNR